MTDNREEQQPEFMKELVNLSKEQSQLSAERTYLNAERTLSVWVRTALAAMIFGLAIDRFGLMLHELPVWNKINLHHPDKLTRIVGFVLVIYSMIIALLSAIRYRKYCYEYGKQFKVPAHHGKGLPSFYAYMVVLFGAGLLVLMIWI